MNTVKSTIKFALLGTAFAAMSVLSSCNCGGADPAPTPVYVAPDPK